MNKCVDLMMQEHELIVEVLAALQAMAEKLAAGGEGDDKDDRPKRRGWWQRRSIF